MMSLPKYGEAHIWELTVTGWVEPDGEQRDQLPIRSVLLVIDSAQQGADFKVNIGLNSGYESTPMLYAVY